MPTTGTLQLTLTGTADISNVRVTDLRGATVSTARYDGNGILDVSNLAKGMYLISINDGQQTFRQRFVKE